jgi:hypothetical protein
MRQWLQKLILCAGLGLGLWPAAGSAQGTIPLALTQQFGPNGLPLVGCILYFYQAGTVATPQLAYQDFGLTIPIGSSVTCDAYGRIPIFWLANGLIHFRLTDASGLVLPNMDATMQVLGPSSGGGGGGGGVDPTTISATGDVKFRMTNETVTGWVKLNATTIGNATSGATGRANADTQNLFVYLWTNCTNAHCPVAGGRGASALADFSASKTIGVPDWRDRAPIGRDCMEAGCAGVLLTSNISSGGGDGVDTPGASGGLANALILQTNLPAYTLPAVTITDPGHAHTYGTNNGGAGASPGAAAAAASGIVNNNPSTSLATTGISASVTSGGGGQAFAVMNPFILGTYYIKL